MTCGEDVRCKCDACDDWYCAKHEGHVMEKCDCEPCDDCGDLFPPDELDDDALCKGCRT
jgi:hypothetical protein